MQEGKIKKINEFLTKKRTSQLPNQGKATVYRPDSVPSAGKRSNRRGEEACKLPERFAGKRVEVVFLFPACPVDEDAQEDGAYFVGSEGEPNTISRALGL